jgi:hypothetical protein
LEFSVRWAAKGSLVFVGEVGEVGDGERFAREGAS